MIEECLKIRAKTVHWRNKVEFFVKDGEGIATGLMMNYGTMKNEPTFSLNFEEAQLLMDDLWKCGLRPTEKQPGEKT